ncbi:MAG: hypothetical protein HZB29_13945 [Nitrospinae bacterium]|nr:hypothetical protein [Nitrospinota bacterium]
MVILLFLTACGNNLNVGGGGSTNTTATTTTATTNTNSNNPSVVTQGTGTGTNAAASITLSATKNQEYVTGAAGNISTSVTVLLEWTDTLPLTTGTEYTYTLLVNGAPDQDNYTMTSVGGIGSVIYTVTVGGDYVFAIESSAGLKSDDIRMTVIL